MRLDASQVLAQGGVRINTGSGQNNSLKVGDVLRATVISSGKNGEVALKTENGDTFSAKMGNEIRLFKGDTVLLEVSGKEKGILTLTFGGTETADEELTVGQTNIVRDFNDKSLEPFARKLSQLNMPVSEKTASLMRELISQNPSLTMDEAAFLASNKIVDDAKLMRAALDMLAGRGKLDALIGDLLAGIKENNEAELRTPVNPQGNAASGDTPLGQAAASQTNATPLTDLLTTLVKNAPTLLSEFEQAGKLLDSRTQKIITQTNVNMQTNEENLQKISQFSTQDDVVGKIHEGVRAAPQGVELNIALGGKNVEAPSILSGDSSVLSGTGISPENVAADAQILAEATKMPVGEAGQTTIQQQAAPLVNTEQTTAAPTMSSVVTELLSDIPEFSGTPREALEQFSNMLLKIAGENAGSELSSATLTSQLEKLFTKISLHDPDAGARLGEAKEELFTRLSLIEEAMSNASGSARTELMDGTHRLMNHVRVLNSIEQFAYMQLPVQLSDEQKAAELYVFKRKGGKRGDKESVNILLAIQLEFMGHWEALINIKGKDVSVNMEVPGKAEKEHFSENTVLLHQLLDEAGFKLVSTNITFTETETTPLTALSTLDKYIGNKLSTIDFKI